MKFLILILSLLSTSLAFAKKPEKVDDILDRLERKLMEAKQDSFLLNDKWNKPIRPTSKKTYSYKKTTISPVLPSQSKLQEVALAIESIEKEVNKLSADMERMKQILGQKTNSDSQLEIVAEVKNPKTTIIRDLTIHLDNYEIFKLNPSSGLWTPRAMIPIYTGPLQAGTHTLKISGRVSRIISKDLPIDDNTFNIIEGEYVVKVNSGKFAKGLKIKISEPDRQNYKTKAEIVEYSL